MIDIKRLKSSDIDRIAEIDRSEHVTTGYVYRHGKLEVEDVDWHVPRWFTNGRPEHSVQAMIQGCKSWLERDGTLFGAFDGNALVGVAIYCPWLTETMAQLAFLHVSNGHRRMGAATLLVAEVTHLAREDGAGELYVSATPSESAVGFYTSQGFRPIDEPHPELYALEPEDIHMIKTLYPVSKSTVL